MEANLFEICSEFNLTLVALPTESIDACIPKKVLCFKDHEASKALGFPQMDAKTGTAPTSEDFNQKFSLRLPILYPASIHMFNLGTL